MEPESDENSLSDLLGQVYKRLKERIEQELKHSPYAIVRLRVLKKELKGQRGLQFITRKLSKEYKIRKVGSWLIVTQEK
ncbi:MAG: hypothetical protein NDP13_02270 [Crenarchaeota archaeon]|nr:hypothetical protein [Thermoproteota archaeon]MCR8453799.1 hypothetical protein [Thermoproteota archaeon]MCR8455651.1 hypothetical protein [Thermoproteota archaeon]MCR8462873.1 hypothetical protein [Thermoproteota archaeon]MCR8470983.1 hypothetical protein [Thermoproteota archaeon]